MHFSTQKNLKKKKPSWKKTTHTRRIIRTEHPDWDEMRSQQQWRRRRLPMSWLDICDAGNAHRLGNKRSSSPSIVTIVKHVTPPLWAAATVCLQGNTKKRWLPPPRYFMLECCWELTKVSCSMRAPSASAFIGVLTLYFLTNGRLGMPSRRRKSLHE